MPPLTEPRPLTNPALNQKRDASMAQQPVKRDPIAKTPSKVVPKVAVAVRTFGNSPEYEGVRVPAGTRFAIGEPFEGLKVIAVKRYLDLEKIGLLRPWVDGGANEVARDATHAGVIVNTEPQQLPKPKKPRPIKAPSAPDPTLSVSQQGNGSQPPADGSQTGAEPTAPAAPASSSEAVPPPPPASSRRRAKKLA